MTKLIAPSLLSADFSRLGEEIKAAELAGADLFHLDVMDGHFVPNITMGPIMVAAARKTTNLPLDTHLMIENPEKYLKAFVDAGSNWISVHQECTQDLPTVLQTIRNLGCKAGVAINPGNPVATLDAVLSQLDYVLVMTVHPGFGGQAFIASELEKVKELVAIRKQRNLSFLIEVDGGIKLDTIAQTAQAGCDVFVSGSGIYKNPPYQNVIQQFKKMIG